MWLTNLADGLRARGLTVIETDGWKTRGFARQGLQEVRGVVWHHTATNRAAFATNGSPTLNLVTSGRSDLAGPLCNILFAREGEVVIVAAGLANHAGSGKWTNIDRNAGNYQTIGIEMESSGIQPWDWTKEQFAIAPQLGWALRDMYGHNNDMAHYEYSDAGKIDPAGWPGGMDGLRASITNYSSRKLLVPNIPDLYLP